MDVVVSRAFQVLSDSDKKSRYDKFGGDPDSRFNPGAAGPSAGDSPFGGFGGGFPRSSGGSMFEEEISPEELFNRFFGSGFGGMGGGEFSSFGMGLKRSHISSNIWVTFFFANPVQVAHSLSSTWEEVPASVFTSSVAPGHEEGPAKLPQMQTSHPPGLSSKLFSLSSSSLSFLFSRRSSPSRAAYPPVRRTASMPRYPRTPCIVQRQNTTSITLLFRPISRTTARGNSASWISAWKWSTSRNCGTNASLRLICASV